MRYTLLLLLIATPLFAQDEKPAVDLAVAFPATTMVYVRADTHDYFESLNPKELLAGIEGDFSLPDLGQIARDRLELDLTDSEAGDLAAGIRKFAVGLLDVGLSGPKFAIVIEHKDLSALSRALKDAQKDGASTVPDVQDYYGTLVYEIELPLPPTESRDDFTPDLNPFSSWATNQAYWVAVFNNFLVIATSDNAVKDAVDYLSYPEDPMDTLLGNSRYKEAIADFEKPQGLLFVNVQSVINTIERIAGDKGSAAGMWGMFADMLGTSEEIRFYVNLIQYEQFKSFAAGFWLDEQSLTVRMDANLVFHNAPGWFEAVRIEPKPMPLTDYIPSDAMFAVTDCVEDVNGLYDRAREFFASRAKAAGHARLVEAWDEWEKQLSGNGVTVKETLSQLGLGQAMILMPKTGALEYANPVAEAWLFGLKNRKHAEEYFYGKLLNSPQRDAVHELEGALTPITVVNGVEVHHDLEGNWAFAFLDAPEGAGVFAAGELSVIKRVIEARSQGTALSSMAAWRDARELLYDTGSVHLYLNFGAILRSMNVFSARSIMWGFDMGEEVDKFDRDDTEKDDDPIPYLSEFFSKTVIVGSARSDDSSVSFRLAAAGWPDRERMRGMAMHYRDVERNRQVRDDFVRVRNAARTHLAVKGKAATEVKQLVETGQLAREEWAVDPYGANDEGGKQREYVLAPVPADVDIRQAILCAHQREPGLRGNYLAILWNSHVVELTPQGLKQALALAAKGQPLPAEGVWYRDALKPLHTLRDPRTRREEVEEWDAPTEVEVAVIDDEGNETTIRVEESELQGKTEEHLDKNGAEPKKD
jgi:hypothetical protein